MSGEAGSSKFQIGIEGAGTPGTEVNATAIYRGVYPSLDEQPHLLSPEEDTGYLSGTTRTADGQVLASLEMPAHAFTFEQAGYVFACGIENVVAGAADGAGSGKISTYTLPTTAPKTIKTATLESGDNQQEYQATYGVVSEIEIAGKADEKLVQMSAKWFARQKVKGTFTPALSLVAVESVAASKASLWIDAAGGTLGTSQVSATLPEWKWKLVTGWRPFWGSDGQLYFSTHRLNRKLLSAMFEMTYLHNGSAVTEYDAAIARTVRQIQLKIEGNALATPGTAYTYKTLKLNLAGTYSEIGKIDEMNGDDVVKATFKGAYDGTAAFFGNVVLVNEVASLP